MGCGYWHLAFRYARAALCPVRFGGTWLLGTTLQVTLQLRLSWPKGKTNSSEGVNFENDVLYANGVELQIPMR